jgi:Leucine-rich repeat (LRR) protein
MTSITESAFSVHHLLILLLVNQTLVNPVFSETVQYACPSKCTCEVFNDSTNISVTGTDIGLSEIPSAPASYSVQSLDLSDNKLTRITELIFKDYRTLELLSLSYNEIDVVDSRAFFGLEMLRKIDLSHNKLRVIPPDIFSNNSFLERVSFSENPLVYVPDSKPILASTSVWYLDLISCSLTSIITHTFSQLPSLQTLNLNSNKLQEIHQHILNPLKGLENLDLGNNPWKCNCDVVQALSWLSDRRKSRGLEGEHSPVKCVDRGMNRTIWTAANKNKSCADESGVISTTTTILTESAQILQPKEYEEGSPTAVSSLDELLSWIKYAFLFLILTLILAVFILIVRRYFFQRITLFSCCISCDSFRENYVTHSVLCSEDRSSSSGCEITVGKGSSEEITLH